MTEKMVKQKSVTVAWQVVFTFIPFVNLWAFYRIQKLRLYLLIIIGSSIIAGIIMGIIMVIIMGITFGSTGSSMEMLDVSYYISSIGVSIAIQLLAIYLVVKWSRNWNAKF